MGEKLSGEKLSGAKLSGEKMSANRYFYHSPPVMFLKSFLCDTGIPKYRREKGSVS